MFDIVCSFGFVEHFKDFNDILRRHMKLVAPGGLLIISIPHFSQMQYFFHWLIDRENLKRHNTSIMNLVSFQKAFNSTPFTIQHLTYYKTFGFWTEREQLHIWEKFIQYSIKKFGKTLNILFGYERPNQFFSPHIICIAQKN